MTTDELRDMIWEYLFQNKATKSMRELSALSGYDVESVRAAVSHEWFSVAGDNVSIAFSAPGVA
jgi:hypothetical protein